MLSAVLFLVFSDRILWAAGSWLVLSETPQKADIIEVLGGDYEGNRISKACELVRSGFAPKALISGGGKFYGFHESRVAIDFAVAQGCPADYFIPWTYPAKATTDELDSVVAEFRRRGIHKVLLVTSPSHTARATRVFRRIAPDLEVHTVAAADPYWNHGYWWKSREGRKMWLLETLKTFADFLRL